MDSTLESTYEDNLHPKYIHTFKVIHLLKKLNNVEVSTRFCFASVLGTIIIRTDYYRQALSGFKYSCPLVGYLFKLCEVP